MNPLAKTALSICYYLQLMIWADQIETSAPLPRLGQPTRWTFQYLKFGLMNFQLLTNKIVSTAPLSPGHTR